MAKRNLAEAMNAIAGQPVEAPAERQRLADAVRAEKRPVGRPRGSKYNKSEWGQLTFMARYETAYKIRAIADYSRLPIMEVIEQAFNAAIEKYEAKNGVIDLEQWRANKEATKQELFK